MTRRRGVFVIGMLVVVASAWGATIFFPPIARRLGIGGEGAFFDLRGSLAAGEAMAAGHDPYAINPFDAYERPHLYSSWWLVTGRAGLTQADAVWLGPLLLAMFLGAVVWVWQPQNFRELAVSLAVLLSPAWLFAVFRTNNDIVVFLGLVVAFSALQRTRSRARVSGAGLLGALTVLKYFPAGALVGILGARSRREMLVLLATASAVIGLGWPTVAPALEAVAKYAQRAVGLMAFGAPQLRTAMPDAPHLLVWVLAAGLGYLGFRLGAPPPARSAETNREDRDLAAVGAAAVTLVSFAAGSSYAYKLIFLWPLVAWLAREASPALGPRRARSCLALVLFACWSDGLALIVCNVFEAGWSNEQRRMVVAIMHGVSVGTQLGCWILMGVCVRLIAHWTRRQWRRLAQAAT